MLVLAGVGGQAFASGADLKEIETLSERVFLPEGPEGFTRLTSSKPTTAAIDGWCVAGGLELALWCDLRIATATSQFGIPRAPLWRAAARRGHAAPPAIVGLGRALDLILTGRVVDASEALTLGLITEMTPPARHMTRALEVAEAIAGVPQENDAGRPPICL